MSETALLRMQGTSLQFSDSPRQQEADVLRLFEEGVMYPIKVGTEAGKDRHGNNKNREFLKKFAREFNHRIHFAGDNWVAVDRDIISPKSLITGDVFVADSSDTYGPGHDRIMPFMSWDHVNPGIGTLSVGAVHYPTKGALPGSPNYDINKLYAERIHTWMQRVGKGRDLAFVGGDFNMPDDKTDWAFGYDFTSIADELEAWKGTGHGPIDGFVSYNRDGRVTAKRFRVLNDREMKMHSDHFMYRAVWEVSLLAA